MTTYGIDISSYQNGLPLEIAKREGYEFAIIKATEGHTYLDPAFHSHMSDARAQGMLTAAYLYVWHNSTPEQMASAFAAYVGDTSVPVILDIEDNSGGNVDHFRQTVDALRARGYRVPLTYLPRWYWQKIGSPSLAGLPPLWSSAYPAGGGIGSDVYTTIGGDSGVGWADYGGLAVEMWQFTNAASLAGGNWSVDGNAYRGSVAQLSALITGAAPPAPNPKEDDMTPEQEALLRDNNNLLKTLAAQMCGDGNNFGGYPQGGGRTLYDLAAAIAAKTGVSNTRDTKEGARP